MSVGRRLRIVYVWDADYPWDVRTEKVCASLTEAGHDVHIVARNRGWLAEVERRPEGTVRRMRPWRAIGRRADALLGFPAFLSPRWYRLIDHAIHDVDADLVVVRDLPLAPTAIYAARAAGVPIVCDMAEHYPAAIRDRWILGLQRPIDYLVRNPRLVEAVEAWCLPRLDRIIVTADEHADYLMTKGVPADRLDLVYNTPPRARALEPVQRRTDLAGSPLEVAYLGIVEAQRGLGELLDAAARLRGGPRRVRVQVVGGGIDLPMFRAHADRLGLGPDEVVFHGQVPHRVAIETVARADVGANPLHSTEKHDTCIPNKLFDYMAAALPVLTSDSTGSARVVRETACGEVFHARDVDDLVAALDRLHDGAARERFGRHGRAAVLERYNWERDTEVLLASVDAAVAAAHARRERAG